MVNRGNWLVPTFLGRFAYFKPPLLYWASAVSVRLLGESGFSLRLPSVLAAAGTCTIIWFWVRKSRGILPAFAAVILVTTDHYWIMMGSSAMTDAPLVFFSIAAIWIVSRDLRIQHGSTLWLGAFLVASAVLTKSAAAVIPALTVVLCAKSSRVWMLLGVAVGMASPWFIYTVLIHGRWFWDEHVLTELLGNSIGANPMSTRDSNLVFYAGRLFVGDAVVAVVGTIAIVIGALRRTIKREAVLWLACNGAALLLFRYHAAPYLLPFTTALALIVGFCFPVTSWRTQMALVAGIAIAGGFSLYEDKSIVWTGTNVRSARALESYCELGRDNGLFIMQGDDEYYSAVLPLRKVYYGIIGPDLTGTNPPMDWRRLGVVVTREQFDERAKWWPIFGSRLAAMGMDLNEADGYDPRGTAVVMEDEKSASAMIKDHPELDFFVPRAFALHPGEHYRAAGTAERLFLFSRMEAKQRDRRARWNCRVGR